MNKKHIARIACFAAMMLVACVFVAAPAANQATQTPTEQPGVTETSPIPSETHIASKTTATPSEPTDAVETNTAPTEPPVATKTPIVDIGSPWVRPADGMVMVYVPEGEFTMGSSNGDPDEQPVHQVFLDAYWIDQTEVTNGKYMLCVQAGGCKPRNDSGSKSRSNYYGNSEYGDYPVVYVNWNDAQAYCAWAEARLPSEAEWEKAARGTDGRIYPWGNSDPTCNLANLWPGESSCVGDTSPVGSYQAGASPYGALDMAGNLWEWVADRYDQSYYSQSPSSNPTGPNSGKYHVLRGGSWVDLGVGVRSSRRFGNANEGMIGYIFGFRCVLSQ